MSTGLSGTYNMSQSGIAPITLGDVTGNTKSFLITKYQLISMVLKVDTLLR